MIEPAMVLEAEVERPLAGMPERRMAEVMGQRQGFGEVFVQAQLARQRARNLCDFQGVGQPGAVMIAFVEHEYLGLMLQPAKSGGMDHAVAIAPESAPGLARRLF